MNPKQKLKLNLKIAKWIFFSRGEAEAVELWKWPEIDYSANGMLLSQFTDCADSCLAVIPPTWTIEVQYDEIVELYHAKLETLEWKMYWGERCATRPEALALALGAAIDAGEKPCAT